MQIQLFNTLTRSIEPLKPLKDKEISLYTCGPTVYHFAHLGNLRTYIFEDILRRTLTLGGFKVTHAMNITDVGHLVGDGDDGEDKMEVGAKREGIHPLEVARKFEDKFFEDIKELQILHPDVVIRATETIAEQIEIIKLLEEKGFTYQDKFAIYFDTSKLSDYGKLTGQNLSEKLTGAREDVVTDTSKKHPADFALWFFLKGRYENHVLQWDSPWGKGFPGWHIECSAISRKALGQPFDIHCGGVDHIGTHHTNEIAQSEAAFGVPLCHTWMHGEFLNVDNKKMAKSDGSLLTLDFIKEKGFTPLAYRYFCLTAHYRTQLNFSSEALTSAQTALERLYTQLQGVVPVDLDENDPYVKKFFDALADDLNAPKALAVIWEILADDVKENRKELALTLFQLLGFPEKQEQQVLEIPAEVTAKLEERKKAKENGDYTTADTLRQEILDLGYQILDTKNGQAVKKISK